MSNASEELIDAVCIRSLRDGESDAVYELIRATFGGRWPGIPITVSARDHLDWKMQSPDLVPSEVSVIELEERLIGYWGSINRDVWLEGRRLAGRFGVDRLVHPEFQGQGLSSVHREWLRTERPSTTRAVNVGVHSNNTRLRGSANRRGGRVLTANTVQILRRPLRLRANFSDAATRLAVRPLVGASRDAVLLALNRLRHPHQATRPEATVEDVEWFDERANALWSETRDEFDYAVVRDSRYLNWRYCDPRAGQFRIRAAFEHSRLLGFMVTGIRGDELKIVDFLSVGDQSVLSALIADALLAASGNEVSSLSVVLPKHHRDRGAFEAAGFRVADTLWNHGHTPGYAKRIDLLDNPDARLHVSYGDEDAV